jgi:hypothetical protein
MAPTNMLPLLPPPAQLQTDNRILCYYTLARQRKQVLLAKNLSVHSYLPQKAAVHLTVAEQSMYQSITTLLSIAMRLQTHAFHNP